MVFSFGRCTRTRQKSKTLLKRLRQAGALIFIGIIAAQANVKHAAAYGRKDARCVDKLVSCPMGAPENVLILDTAVEIDAATASPHVHNLLWRQRPSIPNGSRPWNPTPERIREPIIQPGGRVVSVFDAGREDGHARPRDNILGWRLSGIAPLHDNPRHISALGLRGCKGCAV